MKLQELWASMKNWVAPAVEIITGEVEDEEVEAYEIDHHGYVVVNLTQKAETSDGLLVMPAEEPCTHITLSMAMNLVARLHADFGHQYGKTMRIYRLSPVPNSEIRSLFDKLKEIKET